MSAFSTEWLNLREPADHRSRNMELQKKVILYVEQIAKLKSSPLQFLDLGSGTGSNLRALAPHIHHPQEWTLVDYDGLLLKTAHTKLSVWADEVVNTSKTTETDFYPSIPTLTLIKNQQRIIVNFLQHDLAKDVQSILSQPADLITAAAFFDLVAQGWLERFCTALKAPLYTVLTYNGTEKWSPADPTDLDILQAFHSHQGGDKGFGPAAGPQAIAVMEQLLNTQGFEVSTNPSPWILDERDSALIQELAMGTATAAAQTGQVSEEAAYAWGRFRSQSQLCEIGHDDLFALPQTD